MEGISSGAPEFKLGQASDEGFEFVRALSGQSGAFDFRIHLGRKKADQQIDGIDSHRIRNNIEALDIINSEAEQSCHCR